jgi:hypothetical protein
MLHRFHGMETFIDRRVEILDGLTANSTTHRMQSEGVVVAIISTIIPAIVATTIVVAAPFLRRGCEMQELRSGHALRNGCGRVA